MDNHCSLDIAAVEDISGAADQNKDEEIILPNCIDLDWAQIIYAINYKRILFLLRSQTWSSFYTENSDNAYKYSDYTTEELSHRFLQRVLPNIFDYELTEHEFHLLKLMVLHPNFEKTSTGFKVVERTRSLLFPSDEAAIKALIATKALPNEAKFVGSDVQNNNQIITVGMENSINRKFRFNAENNALLAVALCSDEELPNCELLPIEEVFKRLKSGKSQFENIGYQLENVNISIDDLLKKVNTISKFKEAVAKLVDSMFCRETADN